MPVTGIETDQPVAVFKPDRRNPTDKTAGKELKTILIIDDEPALLELLTKTLLFKGFQVLPAGTGRRGIEFAIGAHLRWRESR